MTHNREELRQFAWVALCEAALVAVMFLVYALIGRLSTPVLLGGIVGAAVSILNFLFLTISVTRAADRASESGDAAKAQLMVRGSAVVRLFVMAGVLIVMIKFAGCDPLATVLPLLMLRPGILLVEFLRKDKDNKR